MFFRLISRRRYLCIFASIFFATVVVLICSRMMLEDNVACTQLFASTLIQNLCIEYMRNETNGRFCKPLCKGRIPEIQSCHIHHSSTLVIHIKWNNFDIILKKKQTLPSNGVDAYSFNKIGIPERVMEILGMANLQDTPLTLAAMLRKVNNEVKKYLKNSRDMQQLINQKEFLFLLIFNNLFHVPQNYGSCGSIYAMEYFVPLNVLFPGYVSKIPWRKKIRIALNFLDLLKEYREAAAGPLSICDMKTSDFGVRQETNIVSLDYDLIFTKKVLDDFMSQPNCNRDADCDFFDCKSKCNVQLKKCTKKMTSNNLQLLCQKIFMPSWPEKGVLHDLPKRVGLLLKPHLEQCVSEEFGLHAEESDEVVELSRTFSDALSKALL